MKTLYRYIFLEILRFTSLSLAVFLGILVTAKILRLTSLVINKGISVGEIVVIFLSIIPSFIEIALPMSVLLGTMLAFARLSLDSEIVVMRASGINLINLIKPVVTLGLIATVVGFITAIFFRPWGNSTLETKLFQLASTHTTANLTEGTFNKLGTLTIYSDKIGRDAGQLGNVLIDDRRDSEQRMIIAAESGQLVSDPDTRMLNIQLFQGEIHSLKKDGIYNITHFAENIIKINPQELEDKTEISGKKAREMYVSELKQQILLMQQAKESGELFPSKEALEIYKIELARKYTMPFACLILALLAMPLGIHPPRSHNTWGQALSLIIGMLVFVMYYALLSVGITLSKDGTIDPSISLWIPNVVFLAVTLFALNQMGSERWNSILHMLNEGLEKISRKFSSDLAK